jgi:Flp pilus assembly pilin Flp
MRDLTNIELQAISGGATAVEYPIVAATIAVAGNEKALAGLAHAFTSPA